MKQATQRASHEEGLFGMQLEKRLKEAGCLVLIAIGIFLFVALLSYGAEDPGWSHTGQDGWVANAAGKVGAYTADLLFSLFGYMAYLLPATCVVGGVRLFKGPFESYQGTSIWVARVVGVLLTLLGGCALMGDVLWQIPLPMSGGGVIGAILRQLLLPHLNPLGFMLIMSTLFLTGITLFSGLSWVRLTQVLYIKMRALIRKIHIPEGLPEKLRHLRRNTALDIEAAEEAEEAEEWAQLREDPLPRKRAVKRAPKKVVPEIPLLEALIDGPEEIFASPTQSKKREAYSGNYALPLLQLLEEGGASLHALGVEELQSLSRIVETRLSEFGVEANVVGVLPGPVITRLELDLAPGIKVSKVSGLAKDLARALSVTSVRIVEVIPGKSYIGLEIPNTERELVRLRDILASESYTHSPSPVTLALGKDIAGRPLAVDLGKMPHLLVAGTTGSGKSVGLNAMLLSLLYKASPEEVRLLLIDPKMLELAVYEGIPHLLTPVVTDMKDAANGLRWCVAEMERRYQLMAQVGVRNIAGFNRKVEEGTVEGLEGGATPEKLPFIVVVIDEFADMMMVVGKKVEELIARIAQKARAAGIHLILATQRPSVDVITGLIKANIPTRIAFQVSSRIDSRTILDQQGAEQLLGHGDMLYLPPGSGVPVRVHGAFVADEEVHRVVAYWRETASPNYLNEVLTGAPSASEMAYGDEETDSLYDEAVNIVTSTRKASISHVQRRLKIGYNRAARLLETMEQAGVVSNMQSNGAREVLAPPPVE